MHKTLWNEDWTCNGKKVQLPHDAMLYENRSPSCDNGANTGYYPGGIYIYEKKFIPDTSLMGKIIKIRFEGVYGRCTVSFNGQLLIRHAYGYTPFEADLTGSMQMGQENILRVEVDNRGKNSRWYSGSGIIRDVWLLSGDPKCCIADLRIHYPSISDKSQELILEIDHTGGTCEVEIPGAVKTFTGIEKAAGQRARNSNVITSKFTVNIEAFDRWTPDDPKLYTLRVNLFDSSSIYEYRDIPIGFRKLNVNHNGLFVNDTQVLLRGACIHHDNGLLGAASYRDAEFRKVRLLKEAGFNAVRCAHNTPSEHFLDACDELGLFVIDEAFDMWYIHKNSMDYASDFSYAYTGPVY